MQYRGYKRIQKTDKDGILNFIQSLEYNYLDMTVTIKFFNNKIGRFTTLTCCPEIGLMQSNLTQSQYFEIIRWAEKNFKHINGELDDFRH